MCIGEEEHNPTRKRVTWSESLEQRLIFLYLCIAEEETTPYRKRVTWSSSLEQRLWRAEVAISVLVNR